MLERTSFSEEIIERKPEGTPERNPERVPKSGQIFGAPDRQKIKMNVANVINNVIRNSRINDFVSLVHVFLFLSTISHFTAL